MRLISLLLVLAACNPYNRYCPPCVDAPAEWKSPLTFGKTLPDAWWTLFNDERLNALEEQALAANNDLGAAWFRFRQSFWISRAAWSQLFPQITFDPSYNRLDQSVSFNGLPGAPGAVRLNQQSYSLPFNGQFQVDIWNQLGLQAQSDTYTAESLCFAYQALRLSIAAQLAESYYSIRTLDSEIDVLERNTKLREDQVAITTSRYDAGLVNYTDVSRAQTELTNIRADLEELYRLRATFVNAIAVLIGEPASDFALTSRDLSNDLPTVPLFMPSSLACRRPDIRQAEREVAAAHASIGVAWASFLPSFTLQGTLGYASPFYTDLLSWQARLWGYAYQVSQIIFDGGGIYSTYRASKDAYFQSVFSFQEVVLKAFAEVEDALSNLHYRAKQEEQLILSVRSSKETLSLTNQRYEWGIVDYLDVVDAERTQLEAERAEVRSRGAQFLATVELIKSLGGGWSTDQN